MVILTDQEKKTIIVVLLLLIVGVVGRVMLTCCPQWQRVLSIVDDPWFYPKTNVNTASLAELVDLPSIGPSIAGRLVAGRPFRDREDMMRAGLSKTMVRKLERYLEVR